MQNPESEVLDSFATNQPRRRDLLPWWIKIFTWVFLVCGSLAVVSFVLALFGVNFTLALYGLQTFEPLSATGLFLLAVFLLKGLASFAMWTEKDWAINTGILDASIGIAICLVIMFVPPVTGRTEGLNVRLELLLLIPFLLKLVSIRQSWKNPVKRLS